jgi:hypothetical protein
VRGGGRGGGCLESSSRLIDLYSIIEKQKRKTC